MDGRYDIVIAGGGMVGASLARALAPLGLKLAVVEAVPPAAPAQPSFDDRSTALARGTRKAFEAMGLWEAIAPQATPIARIHVSDRGRFGFCRIEAQEQDVEALGYVVVNRVLGRVLNESLRADDGLTLLCPARIASVAEGDGQVEVGVERDDGDLTLGARLLVAADGARSTVRELAGIGVERRDYRQVAVVGNLATSRPHENTAYERFTPEGPLALLPVAGETGAPASSRSAFVRALPPAEAARVLALGDDEFLAGLQAAFGWRLGRFSRVGRRASYPLALTRADELASGRIVLVGNAAHGLHPIAGQGFNLGMRDVAALVDVIADGMADEMADAKADARERTGGDPGAPALVAAYERWRRSDRRKVVGFTDGLVRLFGSAHPALGAARDLGMLGLDVLPGAKREFARHTMGLAGRLPRLSRGVAVS